MVARSVCSRCGAGAAGAACAHLARWLARDDSARWAQRLDGEREFLGLDANSAHPDKERLAEAASRAASGDAMALEDLVKDLPDMMGMRQ